MKTRLLLGCFQNSHINNKDIPTDCLVGFWTGEQFIRTTSVGNARHFTSLLDAQNRGRLLSKIDKNNQWKPVEICIHA